MAIASLRGMSANMQTVWQDRIDTHHTDTLNSKSSFDACCRSQIQPLYGWLEYEGGLWHFVTDLFSDPSASARRWIDREGALDELSHEGWTVIRAYPEPHPMNRNSENCLHGYGLIRVLH